MLTKRIIPCLDIRNRKVTKGVRFQNNVNVGDPVEMASAYSEGGCDELVFYDITASAEHRPIDLAMVKDVASAVYIPFAVGGGISSLRDMERVLLAGAEKISVNSLAVKKPSIIEEGAKAFGSQCIVLGIDPVRVDDKKCKSGYEITIRGFREKTGLDALAWAKKAVDLGVGEIVVNSVDADGTQDGYELNLTKMIANNVPVPAVAKPDEIRFAEALPKTRSGKIMRRLLKQVAAGTEITGDTTTIEDFNVLARLGSEEE
ncbi:HisA/HisF-related TIM barrel protein [Verrucomicrobiota bacterium]